MQGADIPMSGVLCLDTIVACSIFFIVVLLILMFIAVCNVCT